MLQALFDGRSETEWYNKSDIDNFMDNFMKAVPGRKLDQRTYFMLRNLEKENFWEVFNGIDADAQTRDRARNIFSESELSKMLKICLNQALVFVKSNAHPGSLKGNSTVYRFASDPDSLTAQATSHISNFTRRLQNGRFWESLSDINGRGANGKNYSIAEDCLLNHFEELDASYLPKGLEIMARQDSAFASSNSFHTPTLLGLSSEAVPKYGDFFLQLDRSFRDHKALQVSQNDFRRRFFKPYVERVLKNDKDDLPRFAVYKALNVIGLLANEPCTNILDTNSGLLKKYDEIVNGD